MNKISKYAFNTSTALLLAVGMMTLSVAADPESFSGVATLCAISPEVIAPAEQKGNNGVLVRNDMSFIYLIKSDNSESLMNGWEDQANNSKLTRSGIEFYWGNAVLVPDIYAGIGALVEKFKFKAEEILNGVSGTFKGTGALEGVTVDYELTPPYEVSASTFPPDCFGYTTLCAECFPAISPGEDGIPGNEDDKFTQYDISGWIEGYDP
jgi:hypothetical protein